MRGARGQAEAIQSGLVRPVSPSEARLSPGLNNVLSQGAGMATHRRAGRWRA